MELEAGGPWPPAAGTVHNEDLSGALSLLQELGGKVTEESLTLMPILLSSLKNGDSIVASQAIIGGTRLFCAVLEEMALQLCKSGGIDQWLEGMWAWLVKFKDAVCDIFFEPCSLRTKVLAVKFLDIWILRLTTDAIDGQVPWIQGHPTLSPSAMSDETTRTLDLLMDILQSANSLPGSLAIAVINCLAAIAKNRVHHYDCILSALLNLDLSRETFKGGHPTSIRYALRTAFLGFLRCTHPSMTESRDRLLRVLREMNLGEATEQAIRQVEKLSRSTERSHDVRFGKDELPSGRISAFKDIGKKRPVLQASDNHILSDDMAAKRTRFSEPVTSNQHSQMTFEILQDDVDDNTVNGFDDDDDVDGDDGDNANNSASETSLMDGTLTPIKKMIAMIAALLAEGERGVESLEILISNIHPELLADIVIENMKNLPNNGLSLYGRQGTASVNSQASSFSLSSQAVSRTSASASVEYPALPSSLKLPESDASGPGTVIPDMPLLPNLSSDIKRDPRRDPRRLDPRQNTGSPVGVHSAPLNLEEASDMQLGLDHSLSKAISAPEMIKASTTPEPLITKSEADIPEISVDPKLDVDKENLMVSADSIEVEQSLESNGPPNLDPFPTQVIDEEPAPSTSSDIAVNEGMVETDLHSSAQSSTLVTEDICHSWPTLPLYVELTEEQRGIIHKLAVTRIVEGHGQSQAAGCDLAHHQILAYLVAETDVDGIATLLRKHITLDYHHHKGHELALHILYKLHTIMNSELDEKTMTVASSIYEKFLLELAKSLLDSLPASDKSFSRLLGEAPHLPHSAFTLLEDLCHSHGYDHRSKDAFDSDRVTQGLGAVWSLILGRPLNRQTCLDIALKCAVDSQDEVRAKAIRLVANKLYLLTYASEHIEKFATSMLLSAADKKCPEIELRLENTGEPTNKISGPEKSLSSSENTETVASNIGQIKGIQTTALAVLQAQQQTSLFFALCTKKPNLFQLVFDVYGRATKAVKQSIHRHVPVLVRNLGSSYSELLHILSNPPEGSDNLIMLVLQTLTEETTPAAGLVSAVKHLYETKLKDVAILIPMLSSLSKDEVLPILPRLVDLPLEKFQMALARILQGSAHTGPALTPVEVLVAIHGLDPVKDGIALRKITDACTACFEQRTVFTQQVLAKSLGHLVEQEPLPLLFMRTVIQAIDAFPTLVDFVMGILSKLISRQIWKVPKLWVGFLKCVYQTQPHSFHVLLQLPTQQLETALHRHPNLRGALAAYANQPTIKPSVAWSTLKVLGVVNDPEQQGPQAVDPSSLASI